MVSKGIDNARPHDEEGAKEGGNGPAKGRRANYEQIFSVIHVNKIDREAAYPLTRARREGRQL